MKVNRRIRQAMGVKRIKRLIKLDLKVVSLIAASTQALRLRKEMIRMVQTSGLPSDLKRAKIIEHQQPTITELLIRDEVRELTKKPHFQRHLDQLERKQAAQ